MLRNVEPLFVLMLGIVVCCQTGCGDGGAADAIRKRRTNLQRLGEFYLSYHQDNQRTAANAAELLAHMASADSDPHVRDAITSLEEGDIMMIWNGQLADPAANAQFVLGFESGVPSTGGYVVMADATVRLMTAKQYAESTLLKSSD